MGRWKKPLHTSLILLIKSGSTPWLTTWKNPQSLHALDTAWTTAGQWTAPSLASEARSMTGMLRSEHGAEEGRSEGGFTYLLGIVAAPLSDKDWTRTIGSGQSWRQSMRHENSPPINPIADIGFYETTSTKGQYDDDGRARPFPANHDRPTPIYSEVKEHIEGGEDDEDEDDDDDYLREKGRRREQKEWEKGWIRGGGIGRGREGCKSSFWTKAT